MKRKETNTDNMPSTSSGKRAKHNFKCMVVSETRPISEILYAIIKKENDYRAFYFFVVHSTFPINRTSKKPIKMQYS